MSKIEINPDVLGGLDFEHQFMRKHSVGGARRRVNVDKGDSWLIRFLPCALGPNKRFYARIARHWQDKRQIVCPRLTEIAFGGDEETYCPVCTIADEINADKNEDISKAGFKLMAQMQWLTYVACFEKALRGGEPREEPLSEILLPYEFNHYKSTWDELMAFIQQNKKRTPLSVLDYELGNDFYLSRGSNKALRLDKQDSAPIFDPNDPKFVEYITKLEAACKNPTVRIPDARSLEDFAAKAEERIMSQARHAQADRDDLPLEERAPRRTAAAAPSRTAAPSTRPVAAASPARPAARPAAATPAPVRRPVPQPEPEPEPEPEQDPALDPAMDQGLDPSEGYPEEGETAEGNGEPPAEEFAPEPEPEPEPAPAPVRARRPAAAVARPAAASVAAAAPRRPTPAVARPAARPAAAAAATPATARRGAVVQESLEEGDNVPEEATDQAPAQPLPEAGAEPAEEPTPVQQRGGGMGDRIRNRVATITGKAK